MVPLASISGVPRGNFMVVLFRASVSSNIMTRVGEVVSPRVLSRYVTGRVGDGQGSLGLL